MPIDVKDEVPGAVADISSVRAQGAPSKSFRLPSVADWHQDGGGHVAYISPNQQPLGAAAWLCIGGVLVRAERVGMASSVADNPPFLDQCGAPAANLSELLGWDASDDFTGLICNSGAVGDDNWTIRGWLSAAFGVGVAPIISSSNLRLDIGGGGHGESVLQNDSVDDSGDFTVEVTGLSMSHPVSGYYWFNIRVQINGDRYYLGFRDNGTGTVGHYFEYPGGNITVASASEASTYKFIRTGNTLRAYYGNTQIGTDKTVSGNLTNLFSFSVSNTNAMTCAFAAISAVDGAGDPVYIDPEGDSC